MSSETAPPVVHEPAITDVSTAAASPYTPPMDPTPGDKPTYRPIHVCQGYEHLDEKSRLAAQAREYLAGLREGKFKHLTIEAVVGELHQLTWKPNFSGNNPLELREFVKRFPHLAEPIATQIIADGLAVLQSVETEMHRPKDCMGEIAVTLEFLGAMKRARWKNYVAVADHAVWVRDEATTQKCAAFAQKLMWAAAHHFIQHGGKSTRARIRRSKEARRAMLTRCVTEPNLELFIPKVRAAFNLEKDEDVLLGLALEDVYLVRSFVEKEISQCREIFNHPKVDSAFIEFEMEWGFRSFVGSIAATFIDCKKLFGFSEQFGRGIRVKDTDPA